MNNGYVIEIDDVAVGLLVREGSAFAFHAVEPAWRPLEGRVFAGPHTAEREARRLARSRSTSARRTQAPDRDVPRWGGSMLAGAGPFALGEDRRAGAPL